MATEPGEAYHYKAQLIRVSDGDTVVLDIDVGFRLAAGMPIRLYGLDCPERNTDAGKLAKQYTADWFIGRGSGLSVSTFKNPEKYGRWLGIIYDADEESLNDALLENGHAVPWSGHGPRPG